MSINFTQLFYRDPYCRSFESIVLSCEPSSREGLFEVELEDSAFYPEGGGQPGDRGFLNDVEVVDCAYSKGRQVHFCKEAIAVGEKVKGEVNFERRFDFMQQHSGEHLVSGLAKEYYGCTNVGFHINESEMTLDFDRELSEEEIRRLETDANEAVFSNLPIEVRFPEPEVCERLDYRSKIEIDGPVRLIAVPDIDLCACCGTHLRNTGEIGLIKVVQWMRYKGGVRLTALCGRRALRDYRVLQEQAEEISSLYSLKSRELCPGIGQPLEQIEALEEQEKQRSRQLLDAILASDPDADSLLWVDRAGDKHSLKALAKKAAGKLPGVALVAVPDPDGSMRYALASEKIDLKEMHARLKERFSCRGGGKAGFYQGSAKIEAQELLQFIREESGRWILAANEHEGQ